MKTYNWEGVNPDGYFLDKLEPIPSALPSFQKLFQVSDRKSGSAGMPRPISYAVFCLKKKKMTRRHSMTHDSPLAHDPKLEQTAIDCITIDISISNITETRKP